MLKNFPNTAEEDIELPNMTRTAGYVNVQQAVEYVSSLSHSNNPNSPTKTPLFASYQIIYSQTSKSTGPGLCSIGTSALQKSSK